MFFVCVCLFLFCFVLFLLMAWIRNQEIAEQLYVVNTLRAIYSLKTQSTSYTYDVLYQSIPTCKVAFWVGEGLYKEKIFHRNLYYYFYIIFIINSRIKVTFKTWKLWIKVFKHFVKFSKEITSKCENINYRGASFYKCTRSFLNLFGDDPKVMT